MNNKSSLIDSAKTIIERRGRVATENAMKEIMESHYDDGLIASSLRYFARVTFQDALPVFPALVSLSCEALGGDPEITTPISKALTIIAGAADLHDDIIDQSEVKGSKKTVLGKFGSAVSLLAGDTLLLQGTVILCKECESLREEQRTAIMLHLQKALSELSRAQINESRIAKKLDLTPNEYFEVLQLKAVIPEVHCKIGAIIGNGTEYEVEASGQFGRTFGILSSVREEYADMLQFGELKNRLRNECPPLPMLYSLQNPEIMTTARRMLDSPTFSRRDANMLVDRIIASSQMSKLKNKARLIVETSIRQTEFMKNKAVATEAKLLSRAMIEGF